MRIAAGVLKALGFTALAISLLEPLLTGSRPRRGANAFVILADNSQSLQIRDGQTTRTNGDWMRACLQGESEWKTRLGQDYDVRSYVFDSHLRAVEGFEGSDVRWHGQCTGDITRGPLETVPRVAACGRCCFLPTATAPISSDLDLSSLPPIYTGGASVAIGCPGCRRDSGFDQSDEFRVGAGCRPGRRFDVGLNGESIVAILADEAGKRGGAPGTEDDRRRQAAGFSVSVPARAQRRELLSRQSVSGVRLKKSEGAGDDRRSTEQTLANNSRLVVVDQGGGPYRVLYVSGRPNWEFKFLRRAIDEDKEVELIGLVRIARRQPKFDFRSARVSIDQPSVRRFRSPRSGDGRAARPAGLDSVGYARQVTS